MPPADHERSEPPKGRTDSVLRDIAETQSATKRPEDAASQWSDQAAASQTFHPQDIVAGRFRVIRFLGRGGMGEVYEAEDQELHEHVALKTIRPEVASDARTAARFKQEIHLARKVTHPNVCRIFDLSRHQLADNVITFLTMELLRGETLTERIRKQARMTVSEAYPIVEQMAAALAAAHQAGVVHRDFKSANVILARQSGGAIRAVVTDFGLARNVGASESHAASFSVTEGIVGTPAYMAPEQLEAGQVAATADIYALGVVIYEMVTGTHPFVADSAFAIALKRLKEPPVPPTTHVPDLDPSWERVILRCLDREPANRFAAAEDVVSALRGDVQTVLAEEHPQRHIRRWMVPVLGLLMLALAALSYYLHGSRKFRQEAQPAQVTLPGGPIKPRRSVAVIGFKNLSGRPEVGWLSTALSEMLGSELAAGEKLRTIPGENVARMKIELSLPETDSFGKETLDRIRRNLGADFIIVGSYFATSNPQETKFRLNLRLQDATAGETIASVTDSAVDVDLPALTSRTGGRLREKLGVAEPSLAEAGEVRASMPSNPEAARLYSQGLARLRVFDPMAARELLEKAVAADPNYSLGHSALSAAWSALGYDSKAREEAKQAFELSTNLSREERLSVEGTYRVITRSWTRAIEIYHTLSAFVPDNLEYGLRLAGAQTSAGKGKDALSTVASLRNMPGAEDARIDLAEALAAASLSDYKRVQWTAASAAQKGAAQGTRLVVAMARLHEGTAFWNLGDPDRTVTATEEARRIYSEAGDRAQEATALNNIAIVRYNQGDYEAAKQLIEKSLLIRRQIGNQMGVMRSLNSLANVFYYQGKFNEALRAYNQSLAISRDLGSKLFIGQALHNIDNILHAQSNLAEAEERQRESIAMWRDVDYGLGVAQATASIADVLYSRGDLAGARKLVQESLVLREKIGDKRGVADVNLLLAQLTLDEGHAADAEKLARQADEEFRKENQLQSQVRATAVVAQILLAQQKVSDAQKAIASAVTATGQAQSSGNQIFANITAARIRAASGNPSQALAILQTALNYARDTGQVERQLDARLAIAEIEIKLGNLAAGIRHLKAIQKDAANKGLNRIGSKAARALSESHSANR